MDRPVTDDVSLETLIAAVSRQLLQSQQHRIEAGEPAVFEVSEMTIDVSFVVTKSARGGGGIDLKVVKADAGVQYDRQSVQKVSLKLAAVKDQRQPFTGFGTIRPRETEAQEDEADEDTNAQAAGER